MLIFQTLTLSFNGFLSGDYCDSHVHVYDGGIPNCTSNTEIFLGHATDCCELLRIIPNLQSTCSDMQMLLQGYPGHHRKFEVEWGEENFCE